MKIFCKFLIMKVKAYIYSTPCFECFFVYLQYLVKRSLMKQIKIWVNMSLIMKTFIERQILQHVNVFIYLLETEILESDEVGIEA